LNISNFTLHQINRLIHITATNGSPSPFLIVRESTRISHVLHPSISPKSLTRKQFWRIHSSIIISFFRFSRFTSSAARCEDKDGDGDNGHEQDEDKEDVVVMAGDSKREAAGEELLVGLVI